MRWGVEGSSFKERVSHVNIDNIDYEDDDVVIMMMAKQYGDKDYEVERDLV